MLDSRPINPWTRFAAAALAVCCLATLGAPAGAQDTAEDAPPQSTAEIEARVRAILEETKTPAAAVALVSRDEIRWLAAFVRLLLGRGSLGETRLLGPESIARMETPGSPVTARAGLATGYGLFNYTSQHNGFLWHGHGGGVNNGIADYAYNLEHGVGFFVAVNSGSGKAYREIRNLVRDYLTRDAKADPEPEVSLPPAALAAFTGTYRDFTPRQQPFHFVTRWFGTLRVAARDRRLSAKPLFGGEWEALVAVDDGVFRGKEEARASVVFVRGDGGEDMLLGTGAVVGTNFRRVSGLGVWLEVVTAGLCFALMLSSLLFALVWVPRKIFGRLAGVSHLSVRALPLLAVLALAGSFALFALGGADPFVRLGHPTFFSVGFCVATWLYALLAVAAAVQAWRARGSGIRRGVLINSSLVAMATLVVAGYLAYWGIIGLRIWT